MKYSKVKNLMNEKHIMMIRKLIFFIQNLKTYIKILFFSKQVERIKNKKNMKENKAYTSLEVQHRFTEQIMNVVNIFYDKDEKLKMPDKPLNFYKYKFT